MSTEKIQISDHELQLIINSINFRMKKILRHKKQTGTPPHEIKECDRALDELGPLGYRLRMMRRDSVEHR